MRVAVALSGCCLVASSLAAQARSPQGTSPQAGAAAQKLDPREYTVAWMPGTRPRDPYADQKGRVWFVGQTGNYVARLDPTTGGVTKFEIDSGTNPHNLVVDTKGTVWFTGNNNNRIVKMDPETGKITTYMIPDPAVKDPHTITFDKKGDAWFTAQNSGFVGRFTPSTGEFKLWKMAQGSKPYGIVLNSHGQPYFDLFGTNKIGTIDPATLEFREFVLPNGATRPRRIGITSDDAIWYGDYARGFLGRLDLKTGKTDEYPMPSGGLSLPYGMAVDDRDHVWIAETGVFPNKLVSFDTKKRVFAESIPIGTGDPNVIRHMMFDPRTRLIWFGEDQGKIGSIKVPVVITP